MQAAAMADTKLLATDANVKTTSVVHASVDAVSADTTRYEDSIAQRLVDQARVYDMQGRHSIARDFLEKALRKQLAVHAAEHLSVSNTQHLLAAVCHRLGDLSAAVELYSSSLSTRLAQLGAEHVDVGYSKWGLALVLSEQGNFAEAHKLHEQIVASESQLNQKDWKLEQTDGHSLDAHLRGDASQSTMF